MKRKDRYKVINYAKKQYSEEFNMDFQFKYLSKKKLNELLKKYKHTSMYCYQYCCYGLYTNCWREPFEDGINLLNQKQVNEIIKSTINLTAKLCRKDTRILYCEVDNGVEVIIVTRDIFKEDYLITFNNEF